MLAFVIALPNRR